jgi:hypothetical protein
MTYSSDQLDAVFGRDSRGTAPEDRARSSARQWVRGLDGIAEDSDAANGRRLTASEALAAYGWEVLLEVAAEGSKLLCSDRDAAPRAIRLRRETLGLTERHVAARAGLSEEEVRRCETAGRWPIRTYERIARVLGLDDRYISVRPDPVGNEELTVRLRRLGDTLPRMSPAAVIAIAEAAWVATTQMRLTRALRLTHSGPKFEPSPNYGSPGYAPFEHGYYLATSTRKELGFIPEQPILSMRDLCEEVLGIPVIQSELGEWLAGVTVESVDEGDPVRAIVCNLSGRNRLVSVRRMTLAHELGHLLHDPSGRLDRLRVDEYDDFDKLPEQLHDPVEQRANAFAVEFLIPQTAMCSIYEAVRHDASAALQRAMDEWGVSLTAARYQLWNGINRSRPLDELTSKVHPATTEWEGRESYTTDWHPISSLQSAPARAGRFSAVVVRAAEKQVISWDTAGEYLLSNPGVVRDAASALRDLYPSVWA